MSGQLFKANGPEYTYTAAKLKKAKQSKPILTLLLNSYRITIEHIFRLEINYISVLGTLDFENFRGILDKAIFQNPLKAFNEYK